jgi:hypothetical protein
MPEQPNTPDVPDQPTPADETEEAKIAEDIADNVEEGVKDRVGKDAEGDGA